MARAAALLSLAGVAWFGLWLTNRLPWSVDRGPASGTASAVLADATLILLFGLQHSVMARPAWKARFLQRTGGLIPERSAYLLATTAALVVLFLGWRPIPQIIWDLPRAVSVGQLLGAFLATWAVITLGTRAFLGLREQPVGLRTNGPYRWLRHPIAIGTVLALWCAPHMTLGHLLFSSGMTIYTIVGTIFEGRDLRGGRTTKQ